MQVLFDDLYRERKVTGAFQKGPYRTEKPDPPHWIYAQTHPTNITSVGSEFHVTHIRVFCRFIHSVDIK